MGETETTPAQREKLCNFSKNKNFKFTPSGALTFAVAKKTKRDVRRQTKRNDPRKPAHALSAFQYWMQDQVFQPRSFLKGMHAMRKCFREHYQHGFVVEPTVKEGSVQVKLHTSHLSALHAVLSRIPSLAANSP